MAYKVILVGTGGQGRAWCERFLPPKAVPRKGIPYVEGIGEMVTNHFSRPLRRLNRCSSWVMAF